MEPSSTTPSITTSIFHSLISKTSTNSHPKLLQTSSDSSILPKTNTLFPVVLLFAILFIFFLACICDCRRDIKEKRRIEEILTSKSPEITVVDGESGEEKALEV